MTKITKNSTIGEVVADYPGAAQLLFDIGMHCLGCPSAQHETLEQACQVHGADIEQLVRNLNAYAMLHPKG